MTSSLQSSGPALTYSQLDRSRWNVVDLITILGKQAAPTTLFCDIDMTFVEALRKQFHAEDIQITETAILLKAIAIAQRDHPFSRSILLPFGRIATLENIAGGFTVERLVEGKPAVFFGTIDSPDTKSLEQIAFELKQFTSGKIDEHPQLSRQMKFSAMPWLLRKVVFFLSMFSAEIRLHAMKASFGLSSLGKYGVKAITGPCVCTSTFAVGTIEERPVVKKQTVVIRKMMTLSLLFDHRCMDGAVAARFLADVKGLLEGNLGIYLPTCRRLRETVTLLNRREKVRQA